MRPHFRSSTSTSQGSEDKWARSFLNVQLSRNRDIGDIMSRWTQNTQEVPTWKVGDSPDLRQLFQYEHIDKMFIVILFISYPTGV